MINYSVFAGLIIGLVTAWLFDKYHDIKLPPLSRILRRPPVRADRGLLRDLFIGFGLKAFYPIFEVGLTSVGAAIGGTGALRAFIYGVVNRLLIPLGLHHRQLVHLVPLRLNTTPAGEAVTGEDAPCCRRRDRGPAHLRLLPDPDVRLCRPPPWR